MMGEGANTGTKRDTEAREQASAATRNAMSPRKEKRTEPQREQKERHRLFSCFKEGNYFTDGAVYSKHRQHESVFLLFPFQSIIPDFHSWEIKGEGNTEENQNTEIEHKQNASTPPETLQGGIKE